MKISYAALLLVLIACAQTPPASIAPPQEIELVQSDYPNRPQYEPPPTGPSDTTEVRLEATAQGFLPAEIIVDSDKPIRLVVLSTDSDHTFVLEELGINEELPLGEDVIIELTPPQGTYVFISDIDPGQTVKGTLVAR